MKKAVFLDRDGTLCRDAHYPRTFADFHPFPNTVQALLDLQSAGFSLFIVTNQSGVARGYFSLEKARELNQEIVNWFTQQGVHIVESAICPHHPQGLLAEFQLDCDCRKPKPGMILQLAKQHQIDLTQSYMVGDKDSDVEAGKRAGCSSILIGNSASRDMTVPSYPSIWEFVQYLLPRESLN